MFLKSCVVETLSCGVEIPQDRVSIFINNACAIGTRNPAYRTDSVCKGSGPHKLSGLRELPLPENCKGIFAIHYNA
jgi:hypothetical protein